jgi:hypothetical protein
MSQKELSWPIFLRVEAGKKTTWEWHESPDSGMIQD